ncbi:hypothetical protein [Methylobacterium oxalidis]|uniref:Chorismate lyase n=1 Tax=Methylobacterium oxalidis TaxID=944322 RepID=A0A512J927_9HYPH|nr:hypothetical protein [Methylobacterium oxalidis]GEP06425.1 hypothetical protein MOX02_44630 [Methylobacterium oxalidis]GJE32287.1 hypothetical protein LDDCCGHA_2473 [Methylobacterium oxalidis]GLS63069.1 hypothetical protein GCM10007888_14500 [Methylobacterium oxalidis]
MAMLFPAVPVLAEAPGAPADEAVRPAGSVAEAADLIETLKARLLSGPSATAVLEAWCAERGLAQEPRLVARRVGAPDKPLSDAQMRRLALAPGEAVRYRRVRLTCGSHVLSEADNWYVPGRLTPAMNAALAESDTPFGRVVRPLDPSRRNLGVRAIWQPASGRQPGPEEPLFSVEAVLSTGDGTPFCEVAETYQGAVLGRR